jgi:hypothetical protein
VAAVLLSREADWTPISVFVLLFTLAVLSEPFRLDTKNFYVTTSFLSLVLAMALLGPTPASVIGGAIMLINGIRRRAALQPTLANVSTYACFPLVGARDEGRREECGQELSGDEQGGGRQRIARLAVDEHGERHKPDEVADRVGRVREEQAPESGHPQGC